MAVVIMALGENKYGVLLDQPEVAWLRTIQAYYSCDDLTTLGMVLNRGFIKLVGECSIAEKSKAAGE